MSNRETLHYTHERRDVAPRIPVRQLSSLFPVVLLLFLLVHARVVVGFGFISGQGQS